MAFEYSSPSLSLALLLLSLVFGLVVLQRIWNTPEVLRDRLRGRFVYGVPWGTLVVVCWLLVVYFGIQQGYGDRPVVIRFRAYSLFEPIGWLFGGFAHSGFGHLRNNLTTTVIFAPLVEYAWGHYRSGPAEHVPEFLQRPVVRAVVVFPVLVGLVTVVLTLFSWGPVIGFSIVAFAFMGFALVHFPIIVLLGLVIRRAVRIFLAAMRDPITITEASVEVVRPSWFGIAVQGHLIGFLTGVLLGIVLLRRRNITPSRAHVFLAITLVGSYMSIWAFWWVLGPETFVLFRAVGVAFVVLLATVVLLALDVATPRDLTLPPWVGTLAIALLATLVLGMGIVGILINLTMAAPVEEDPALSVDGYDLYYGENVSDGMLGVVDIEFLGLTTDVKTSGVIVVQEDWNIWHRVISAIELETHGVARERLGGIGWSEDVYAVRTGWVPVGNDSVYRIRLGTSDAFTTAFESPPKQATPIIEDHQFVIALEGGEFLVNVSRNGRSETVAIPERGTQTRTFGVELRRENGSLIASTDRSTVTIATIEEYE